MRIILFAVFTFIQLFSFAAFAQLPPDPIVIEWKKPPAFKLNIRKGTLRSIVIISGKGTIRKDHSVKFTECPCKVQLSFDSVQVDPGPSPTIVSINAGDNSFSFLPRDVSLSYPIFLPDYQVSVYKGTNSYEKIARSATSLQAMSDLSKIENAPEESFETAAEVTRKQIVPTLLGVSRDIRIFQLHLVTNNSGGEVSLITPMNAANNTTRAGHDIHYSYAIGRGHGASINIERSLEAGYLPVLNSIIRDGDITYSSKQFVTLEHSLTQQNKGTHFRIADLNSAGHMITSDQQVKLDDVLNNNKSHSNQNTILFFQTIARNTGNVPRYAWIKAVKPGRGWWDKISYQFDASTGFSSYHHDSIFSIAKMNDKPIPNEEVAVLIAPGDSVVFQFIVPHSPVSHLRARQLFSQPFMKRLGECKSYWNDKLSAATAITLPEKRIQNMIKAGLIHLDLVTYGEDPDGTLAPTIGVYSPIGTESSPIMQFFATMGKHDWSRRSLQFFLDKQHDNGLIQNFGGYMIETGAALWSIGEYFRYTRDTAWVKAITPKVLLSCKYLIDWRSRNKIPNSDSYGLIDGKVADPEDPFHQFMLNGYAYLGLKRSAEMLRAVNEPAALKLQKEADAWKTDIRTAFNKSTAASPVVPLSDGTWVPASPPWTEAVGPRSLYLSPDVFYSHGTFTIPDALLGPLYLVFCEVIDPDDRAATYLLNYHRDLFYDKNVAFSQPYYSRHDWLQLKRGMIKPFLKTYYTQLAALADRETYSFWEHFYHVSSHKTHEEGWFLMATRWMLMMEDEDTLNLLKGIPRKWLDNNEVIEVNNASTYFGNLSFRVESHIADKNITIRINVDPQRRPARIVVRLPHPSGIKATRVDGGTYNPQTETVTIESQKETLNIKVFFE